LCERQAVRRIISHKRSANALHLRRFRRINRSAVAQKARHSGLGQAASIRATRRPLDSRRYSLLIAGVWPVHPRRMRHSIGMIRTFARIVAANVNFAKRKS
jgi:hypothetical protein